MALTPFGTPPQASRNKPVNSVEGYLRVDIANTLVNAFGRIPCCKNGAGAVEKIEAVGFYEFGVNS